MPASIRLSELSPVSYNDLTDSDLFLITDSEATASKKLTFANLKQKVLESSTADIGQIRSLLGSTDSTDLGSFTGTLIPNDSTVKQALQILASKLVQEEQEINQIETDLNSEVASRTTVTNQLTTDIAAVSASIPDVSGFATSTYVDTAVAGVTVDLSGYYTKTEIDTTFGGYYTKTEVDSAIAGATGTDLSNYYTKTEVDGLIPDVDAANFTWNASLIPDTNAQYDLGSAEYKVRHLFLSDNSIKFESGDVGIAGGKLTLSGEPVAMESYVDAAVGSVDLSNYYTSAEIDGKGFLTSFTLGDGDGLELGDDADLKLYFDGSVGVQTSFIESDALIVRSKTNNEEYITAIEDGPVELYYDGSKKFGTSADGATVLGDLTVDGKILFKNVFSAEGDLPSATEYHGMFAHVHGTGAAYFAHAGNWVKLANDSDIPAVPTNLSDLGDVNIGGTPTTGHVLKWDGSNWAAAPDATSSGGTGISLADLSVTQNAASGGGSLTYNNVSGVFEYTPPVIPTPSTPSLLNLNGVDSTDTPATDDVLVYSEADSEFKLENLTSIVGSFALQNIADAGYGVDVTGKIATTDGIDIDIGGSINAAGTTVDFQNTVISFTGASIGGLGPSDVNLGNISNAGYGVDVTGKIATTDGIDIDIGGSLNAAGTSVDFQNATISFSGASVAGLSSTINDQIDFKLDKYNATDGQVLTYDANANGGNGDYTWTTLTSGGTVNEAFKSITVSTSGAAAPITTGNVEADQSTDTMHLVGTGGITITSDSVNDAIYIDGSSISGGGGGGASTLDGLTDVSTANASTGRILEYDGTSWVTSESVIQLQEFQQNILAETAVSNLSFTANNTAGSSPMSVTLSTSYTGNANSFDVDWGDGNQDTGLNSNQLNHTYNNASGGLFDVTVTASNTAGVGFGSNATANREDYIVLYTPQPVLDFQIRQTSTGSEVTGNDRWVMAGSPIYVFNETTNATGVNAEFEYNWGDGLVDLVNTDNSSGGTSGGSLPHTYATKGWYTVTMKLTAHDATDPSYLNSTTTDNIKVYDPNEAEPTGVTNKLLLGGSTATLCSGFTQNSPAGTQSPGSSVVRNTSAFVEAYTNQISYNAENGRLDSVINDIATGAIFMSGASGTSIDGDLRLNGKYDYNLYNTDGGSTSFQSSVYPPNTYSGFKAKIRFQNSNPKGVHGLKLSHLQDGNVTESNEVFLVNDHTHTPSVDVGSVTVTEAVSGAKKFVSGIPYYSNTNSTIRVGGIVANNFTTECYNNNTPVNILSDSTTYAGSGDPVSSTNYSYSQAEGGVALLDGSVPFANVTAYTLGDLDISPASNAYGSKKLRVRARNINGYSSYATFGPIIQTFTSSQSSMSIDETDINVSTSLGNGAYTDGGVRILDFIADTTDTPAFNGAVNFYTHNVYTESVDPFVSGSKEASVIYGTLTHNTTDYSTGYLPVGPDRSGDTGTQYFTFAFRRQVVANFNLRINASGIAGCWVAAPGTAIDNTSGLNGWLDTSQAYAGSGVPGSDTVSGGNGSDGCATNNSSRILTNTSINGTYTMTLGEENMSNATGNVVLVRIALNSGQSISTLEVN